VEYFSSRDPLGMKLKMRMINLECKKKMFDADYNPKYVERANFCELKISTHNCSL